MNHERLIEKRRLILNSKQLYLFQQKAFQLRNKFIDGNIVERKQKEHGSVDEVDEGTSYILGYN